MPRFRVALFLTAGLVAGSVLLSGGQAEDAKAGWVTVKGQVTFAKAPEAKPVDVQVDKAHCLSKGKLFYETIQVKKESKGLKNVVVWIRPDTKDRKDVFPKNKIKPGLVDAKPVTHVIDQPCCQFIPRILAVRAGDGLEVKNSSPVPHNINYKGDNAFNVTVPAGMSHKMAQPFTPSAVPVPFECSIHPWMNGRIRVFEHPYFAVTDEDGKFEIKDVPAGDWRIVYWHEEGFHKGRDGILGFPVAVAGATTELKPLEYELPPVNPPAK